MNKLFLVSCFFLGCLPAFGTDSPDAQALFESAKNKASLFGGQADPFQLEVDFVAQLNVPTQGHLTIRWEGKDRWWSKVVIDGFQQITIRNGEKLYTSRNAPSTPLRVKELTSLLHFASVHDGEIAKKHKRRVEAGLELDCFQVKPKDGKGDPHDMCLNATSGEIVSDEWQQTPDGRNREQFSDYSAFGKLGYPRKLQLQEDGVKVLVANVISLAASKFDETLLVAPKDAVERRECDDMKHATPVRTPDPLYPKSASKNRLMGDTTVSMTVLTDGSVTDIQVIGKATQSMDDATLQTLKGWKFKPAMCGSDPVVSDITVIVSFRLE
jgi:TonB family protein